MCLPHPGTTLLVAKAGRAATAISIDGSSGRLLQGESGGLCSEIRLDAQESWFPPGTGKLGPTGGALGLHRIQCELLLPAFPRSMPLDW